MEDLVRVISVEPTYCIAHLILAELHWKLGKREEAIEIQTVALKAVSVDDQWRVHLSRAEYLLELQRN